MGVKFDEVTRENLKWIMGIVASILVLLIKYTLDQVTAKSDEVSKKVDKVYEFSVDHETRIKIIEQNIERINKRAAERDQLETDFEIWRQIMERHKADFIIQGEQIKENEKNK